jgi:hypothetical protein
MNRHPHLTILEKFTHLYGPTNRRGILFDHLGELEAAGLTTRPSLCGTKWWIVSPETTTIATPVLCGAIVEWFDEDGLRDGRCGRPVAPGDNGCSGHNIPEGYCAHGMSAALCAGPGHYPMDTMD